MKGWQAHALEHARREYALGRYEACGLVVEVKGAQVYVPCQNTHETPHKDFRIAAEAYAAAEELGQVVGVFHSHPDASCHPSEADRVVCEASGLPWTIVGLPQEVWGYCEPCGFQLPYEGRPFVHGVIDCYTMIRDWYRRERSIELPDFERQDEWWRRGQDLYAQNFQAAGFRPIAFNEVRDGDVLLMQVSSPKANHGAVLVDAARNLMLHHMHGRLSEMTVYGGYWRDHTRHFLRHRQCEK